MVIVQKKEKNLMTSSIPSHSADTCTTSPDLSRAWVCGAFRRSTSLSPLLLLFLSLSLPFSLNAQKDSSLFVYEMRTVNA